MVVVPARMRRSQGLDDESDADSRSRGDVSAVPPASSVAGGGLDDPRRMHRDQGRRSSEGDAVLALARVVARLPSAPILAGKSSSREEARY